MAYLMSGQSTKYTHRMQYGSCSFFGSENRPALGSSPRIPLVDIIRVRVLCKGMAFGWGGQVSKGPVGLLLLSGVEMLCTSCHVMPTATQHSIVQWTVQYSTQESYNTSTGYVGISEHIREATADVIPNSSLPTCTHWMAIRWRTFLHVFSLNGEICDCRNDSDKP